MVEAVSIVFTLASIGVCLLCTSKKSQLSWNLLSIMIAAASIFIILANERDATGAVLVLTNFFVLSLDLVHLVGGRNQ